MGLKNYFKAGKDGKKDTTSTPSNEMSEINEKPLAPPTPAFASATPSGFSTPRNGLVSSGASIAPSSRSGFMDDIKHEVMVNYLFQQQCARLWVGDGSGEVEGVLLRKFKGSYLACPPSLSTSAFAMSCAALNVPVSIHLYTSSF
jgi:hypothetical protein